MAKNASRASRAFWPISFSCCPRWPMTMPLWFGRSTKIVAWMTAATSPPPRTRPDHGDAVGNLLTQGEEHLLADGLLYQEPLRFGGELLLGVKARTARQRGDDGIEQDVHAVAGARAHRDDVAVRQQRSDRLELRQQLRLRHPVDLVQRDEGGRAAATSPAASARSPVGHPVGRIEDQEHHVGFAERPSGDVRPSVD